MGVYTTSSTHLTNNDTCTIDTTAFAVLINDKRRRFLVVLGDALDRMESIDNALKKIPPYVFLMGDVHGQTRSGLEKLQKTKFEQAKLCGIPRCMSVKHSQHRKKRIRIDHSQ